MAVTMEEILLRAKIKWVVSIDDEYSHPLGTFDESFLLRMIANEPEKCTPILEKFPELKTLEDLDEKEDRFDYLSGLPQKESILAELVGDTQLVGTAQGAIISDWREKGVIKGYCAIPSIAEASQFLENIPGDWPIDRDNRILWLVDRDFTEIGEGPDAGLDLIKELGLKDSLYNIVLLLTAKTKDIAEDGTKKLLGEKGMLEYNNLACVVSKDLFINKLDGPETIEMVLKGLWGNYNHILISQLTDFMSKSLGKAKDEVLSYSAAITKHLIVHTQESDGISLPDSILRILNILSYLEFGQLYANDIERFIQILYDYRNISENLDQLNAIDDLPTLHKLRHNEMYDDYVNTLRKPTGFGDIFQINTKYYILLSQPCDVAYRTGSGRNILNGLLGRIIPIGKSSRGEHYSKPIEYFGDSYNIALRLDYRVFILVSFDLLDLCTFNNEGKATILLEAVENEGKDFYDPCIPFDDLRIKKILKSIKEKKETFDCFKEAMMTLNSLSMTEEQYRKLSRNFKQKMSRLNNEIDYPKINNDMIVYDIQRIGHLRTPYSVKVYTEFSNYHARVGIPGDLTTGFINDVTQESMARVAAVMQSIEKSNGEGID